MAYADYGYYVDGQAGYGGSKIPEEQWTTFAKKADALIDQLTSGRCKKLSPCPDFVKDAECSAAEILYNGFLIEQSVNEQTGHGSVRSESNDGYSISFGDVSSLQKTMDSAKSNAINEIRTYLANSGLLLRWRSSRYDN